MCVEGGERLKKEKKSDAKYLDKVDGRGGRVVHPQSESPFIFPHPSVSVVFQTVWRHSI